jgi:hypothetical protein
MTFKTCTIDGCEAKHYGRGLCNTHYSRARRNGDPMNPGQFVRGDAQANFWAKVDKSGECWLWTGAKEKRGYGYFNHNGTIKRTHRLSYEWANGPIPDGVQVDHICFNKACVNPAHLRPATNKQNNEHRTGAQRNSKSGVRGVTWHGRVKKWQATATQNKKQIHIGYFDSVEEAAKAALAKRNELFTHNDVDRG